MSTNNLPRDELEALRWFRQRLKALGQEYPTLKTQEEQEKLSAYLAQQAWEERDSPAAENTGEHQ